LDVQHLLSRDGYQRSRRERHPVEILSATTAMMGA
jgi:hypothetical protein